VAEMTSYERFKRTYEHREADRIPIIDSPWPATLQRWKHEGMGTDVEWEDYFGVDRVANINVDNSPRYEIRTLDETDEYTVVTTEWGATVKNWKHAASTPGFLDFTIKDRSSWLEAKKRMTPTRDRVNWDHLRANYRKWRDGGYWIQGNLWFGFDVTHSWTVGTERLLMALVDEPQWCADMFNHFLDVNLALMGMVWDAGYEFDCVTWPDDLGYKHNQFMSVQMYRELLKPAQKRACDWAHARGAKVLLHSCGNVNPFVPEFIEIGVDGLNPVEVKAGMDPAQLKKTYGRELVLHGGINAVLWDDIDAIEAEMASIIPVLKQSGGYVFSSDHSVPSSVSLDNFRRIVELAKKLGAY